MKNSINQVRSTEDNQVNESEMLAQAADILAKRTFGGESFTSASDTQTFLQIKLGGKEREVFAVMLLDSQHRLIEYTELFFGTINSASVHPREIVKATLKANAAAIIISHNHPSGIAEPSQADIAITQRIKDALALIDVPVLDHIIIAQDSVSFAQRGLM